MYNTNKKKQLISIFDDNKDKAFSANYLIDLFKDDINKATIYRQLKSLEENSYIRKTYNPLNESYEYQYSNECNNHFHLQCSKCGAITHLKCKEIDMLMMHILNDHGFLIDKKSTTIFGLCQNCKE